jgi:hypothetical protein
LRRKVAERATRRGKAWRQPYSNGDFSYDRVNSFRQGASGGSYTVQAGDTLQGIAQAVWGDSSYWYKIAEANGLSGDTALVSGQALTLPAGVTRSHNSASTFKPYDPAEALGNNAPTYAKPPKKNKCGMFGQVLLVAIAVAVTVVTSGAALAALGPAGTSIGAGIGAFVGGGTIAGAGVGTFMAAGAIGGAFGSMVSQGIGVATGLQDQFSWKGVALSALAGGINGAMMGVGNVAAGATKLSNFQKFMTSSGIFETAARGAGASALTQGIGVVTGLQPKFDWAGVAAAGVSAVAASQAGGGLAGRESSTSAFSRPWPGASPMRRREASSTATISATI